MTYYIIIRGPLGIGKSTVAQKLAEELSAEYISIDYILKEHGLDKVKDEKYIPAKNFIKAQEIILPQVKEILGKGKTVIFDGNFYHKEQIEYLIKQLAPIKHHVFTLKASLKTCIDRDSKRHKPYGAGAATAVHNLVARFDYGISLDTENKSADEVIKKILSYL